MNQAQIDAYLNSLGMGEALQNRVRDAIAWFAALDGGQLVDMFVSDYVEQNGTRRFSTVVLFSGRWLFEVQNLFDGDNPSMWMTAASPAFYVRLEQSDYDFANATAASRLSCECLWPDQTFSLDLKASGDNCDRLKRIVVERRAR